MKEINCPVCDSTNFKILYPDSLGNELPNFGYNFNPQSMKTYRIVKCLNCTHAYCSPRPEEIEENYVDIEDEAYEKNELQHQETAKKQLKILKRFITSGKLLDVGCGRGDFLKQAKSRYSVKGLELSKYATNLPGIYIFNCHITDLPEEEIFDVITAWGVIEHFENPKEEFVNISKHLKTGGYFCLWTGDVNSIPSKILGKKWWWIMGQHLQFFSKKSIIYLSGRTGFKPVYFGIHPYVMTFSQLSKSLMRYPILGKIFSIFFNKSPLSNQMLTIKLPGELFVVLKKI